MMRNLLKTVKVSFLYVILFAMMILVPYSTSIAFDIKYASITMELNADGTVNNAATTSKAKESKRKGSAPLHLYSTQTFKIKNRNFDNPGYDGAKKTYKIINIDSRTNLIIDGNPQVKLLINRGKMSGDWSTGEVTVYGKESHFSKLGGLTESEKRIARILDKVSVNSKGYIDRVITKMATAGEDPKEGFSQINGHFLANVIRSGAGESDRKEVYGRIGRKDKKENSVWGEMKWNYTKYGEDENSPKEYKDSEVGVMIGFDKEMRKDITLGVYTKVNKHDMSQGEEKGEITKGVIGVYGGYEEGNWEIKTMLDGSMGSYDTKRKINIVDERELKSEFKGVGIGWDVEGALKVPLTGIIRLRPYIGFETRVNKYGDIKESGGERLNWEVKEGSYSRTMTRVGVGIEGEKGTIGFNVGVEYKRLLSGEEAKLDGRMAGQKSDIVGAEEGKEIVGIGVGVSNEVVEDVSVYARGNIYRGKRYENISGNVGVSYRFGGLRKKEKVNGKREEEKAGEKQQREEEVKLGIDEYKLDEETKGNEEDVNREEGVLYLKGHEYDKVVIEGHKDIKRVEILVK